MQIVLKKTTVKNLKRLTGSKLIEALHLHVNELGKGLPKYIEDAMQDLDMHTDTWGEMLKVLSALVDCEYKIAPATDKVVVVIK
mgnify:CR=1 FL=1